MLIKNDKLRLWPLLPAAALLVVAWLYLPWFDHWTDGDEHAELCTKAGDIRALSTFLATTDPYNQLDLATLDRVTLVGDWRLTQRPVMDMPVLYDGIQIPLREHPAMVRIMHRDKAQESLGHVIADDLEAAYCDPRPPWAPHDFVQQMLPEPEPVVETPVPAEMLIASF